MKKGYWELRQEQKYLAGEMQINEYYKGLEKAFNQAKREITSTINDFYMKYAKDNKLSYADTQRLLNKVEISDLQAYISKVNESMGKYDLELNNMGLKARLTRYQALETQIDATLQQLYSIDYELKGKELLKEVYTDQYYRTWYNTDVFKGFHSEFAQIDPYTINELIKYPFNGANFSDRLWKQKDHMLVQLNESLTTMLIQGKHPSTLSSQFARNVSGGVLDRTFKSKRFEAYRLLHTEGSFIIEQGTLAGYKEDGVEKYQILATLDSRTSQTCRHQDGKIYDVDKAVVGVNLSPFHMLCRTTTTPYYEDEDYSQDTRVARDSEGKTYKVPATMKYKEWNKIYGIV